MFRYDTKADYYKHIIKVVLRQIFPDNTNLPDRKIPRHFPDHFRIPGLFWVSRSRKTLTLMRHLGSRRSACPTSSPLQQYQPLGGAPSHFLPSVAKIIQLLPRDLKHTARKYHFNINFADSMCPSPTSTTDRETLTCIMCPSPTSTTDRETLTCIMCPSPTSTTDRETLTCT